MKRTPIPDNFSLTPDLEAWGKLRGYTRLQERMDWFIDYCLSTGKQYIDFKAAWRNSCRGDWAKLNKQQSATPAAWAQFDTSLAKPGESSEQFLARMRAERH